MDVQKPKFKTIKEFLIYYFEEHFFQKSTFYGFLFGFLYLFNSEFRQHANNVIGSSAVVEGIIFYLIGKKG